MRKNPIINVLIFKRAANYFFTFYSLGKRYLIFLGIKRAYIIPGVIISGLLYPIPFAIMGHSIYSMMAGNSSTTIRVLKLRFELGVDDAFAYAIFLAAGILLFKYVAMHMALGATTAWQTSLLWQAMDRLPRLARWDCHVAVPLPFKPARARAHIVSVIRSGFLIGRMVAIGLQDLFMLLGALAILTWYDALSVLLLVVIALMFLPVYGLALVGLVGMRAKAFRERTKVSGLFEDVLEAGVLSAATSRIEASQLAVDDASKFASSYAVVNQQLQRLNLVNLLIGLHVFASMAAIYVLNGATLSGFVRDKVVFFIILIFVMKHALHLTTTMARLTRGYTPLAGLRAFFHPRRKQAMAPSAAPDGASFAVDASDGSRHYLFPGHPAFVVMPAARHAFELIALSNSLKPCAEPGTLALRYVVYLNDVELESLLTTAPLKERRSEITLHDERQSIRLHLRKGDDDLERMTVVALSLAAWQLLHRRGVAQEFCANRTVFVVIADPGRPEPVPEEALLIVSDGITILTAGPFATTYDAGIAEAFRRVHEKGAAPPLDSYDEEEEM